jgi:ferredoxin-nitrite reductase
VPTPEEETAPFFVVRMARADAPVRCADARREVKRVNRIEQIKAEKNGLDVGRDIPRFAEAGWEAIDEPDLERLKWWGIFFRKHTPGHFMMRIRITNGITSAAQLRAIARIANRSGRGVADITTRQQIQLRWITMRDVPAILDELRGVGLASLQTGMDNIRNVVGCPVAGLTPNELLDASPAARAFTGRFVGDPAYTNLPRKFNVTITGCRENCTHAETQDLALVPATRAEDGDGTPGFNVLVGGKNGSGGYRIATPLDVFVTPDEAAELASAVVLTFRDHGARDARNKIRLSFLIEEWGEAKFRDALEGRLGRPLDPAGADARLPKATDHVGIFRQKDAHLSYAGLLVPVGRISGDQLAEVARLAEVYGTGEVRLTPDQNVIVPNVPDTRLGRLTTEPLLKVLRYDPSEIMRGLVSCTGIEFCNLGVIETKSRALQVARGLEAKIHHGRPVRLHWSGCPAGCGNHTVADIGLVGTKTKVEGKAVDAVDVFVGGSSGPHATQGIKILESVPCESLPQVLEGLVRYVEADKVRKQLRAPSPSPSAGREHPPAQRADAPLPTRAAVASRPGLLLDDLADGAGTSLVVDGVDVAVFRREGCLYALENRCPHEGAPLASGALEGDEIVCPLHGYRVNVKTGVCSTDPTLRARPFRLVARDGRLTVDV